MAKKRPRILVVDDDAAVRQVLRQCLERDGFAVSACGGAAAALELLREERFDAVLLDNGMPVMMGLAALPAVLARAQAPVILITGFGDEDTLKDALLLGASEVLLKPFDMGKVAGTLRRLIAERG